MRNFGYFGHEGRYSFEPGKMIDDVEAAISEGFGTDIGRYSIGFLDRAKDAARARELYAKRIATLDAAEDDLAELEQDSDRELSDKSCLCVYAGDLGEEKDYHVFLPSDEFLTPIHLGEEMTHGEHFRRHANSDGRPDWHAYLEKFKLLSNEFIGSLGSYLVYSKLERITDDLAIQLVGDCSEYSDLVGLVAHRAARCFVKTFGDIPYKEIFTASNQDRLWGMVSDTIGKDNLIVVKLGAGLPETGYENIFSMMLESKARPIVVEIVRNGKPDLIAWPDLLVR